jgi:hypothetical protein
MPYIFSRMVLLVAPSRRALPAVTVPARMRTLILRGHYSAVEDQIRAALNRGGVDLIVSLGFAAAVDRRLAVGDLLLATRIFGGADVYLDLPPLQAPGAVRGSLCSLMHGRAPGPLRGRRRLPPVYAFDDHGFWLARAAQTARVPCLLLRSVLLEAPSEGQPPDPLLSDFLGGRLGRALVKQPGRWRELAGLLRATDLCRSHLASALAVLLVLHGQA